MMKYDEVPVYRGAGAEYHDDVEWALWLEASYIHQR
jgi:hypothetical protein